MHHQKATQMVMALDVEAEPNENEAKNDVNPTINPSSLIDWLRPSPRPSHISLPLHPAHMICIYLRQQQQHWNQQIII